MSKGKKKKRLARVFCLTIIFSAIGFGVAHGWGPQGHRVIGYVAELNLAPETKKIIVEEFNINNLADVANWADKVKKKRAREKPWHYANIKGREWAYVPERDCPDKNCVIEKIKEFSLALENIENIHSKRKDALKYLAHFVGDVHEPLHLGNRKDRGGVKIRVRYLGENVSLHYLWDGGLINWKKVSLLKYALHLNNKWIDSEKGAWLGSDVSGWADESRLLALKYAYSFGNGGLSKAYINRGREILEQRMVQAGLRLADLLNKIFKTKK